MDLLVSLPNMILTINKIHIANFLNETATDVRCLVFFAHLKHNKNSISIDSVEVVIRSCDVNLFNT